MQKINLLKKILLLLNIAFTISFIITIIYKNNFTYSLYWILVPILIFILLLFQHEIDKENIDLDINKSKIIKLSYIDTTTISTAFYGLIYLTIEFLDSFNINIKNNAYLVVSFFVISILYELFIYLSIKKASKETKNILNKKNKV